MAWLKRRDKPLPEAAAADDSVLAEATATVTKQNSWLIRLAFILCGGSMAANVALGGALVQAIGQWKPEPVFVRLGCQDSRFIWFEPSTVRGDTRAVVTEKLLAQYVEARESIDRQSEVERWKLVRFLSDPKVSDDFFGLMTIKNPDSPYKKMEEAKQTRNAEVLRVSQLPSSIYQVEYRTRDYRLDKMVLERMFVATISVDYRKTMVKYEDRYMNPFGAVVTRYSIAERQGGG